MTDELVVDAQWLIAAISLALKAKPDDRIADVLARLEQQGVRLPCEPEPRRLPACRYLAETIAASMLVSDGVAAALAACEPHLRWKQNPNYSDAVLGEGYMDGYAYAEIIGPDGFFPGSDFLLGLMILGPRRHYPDHAHRAPELYWTLTGPSWWRRGSGPFQVCASGTIIRHAPDELHATRTGEAPLLALWCWTRDVAEPARLA